MKKIGMKAIVSCVLVISICFGGGSVHSYTSDIQGSKYKEKGIEIKYIEELDNRQMSKVVSTKEEIVVQGQQQAIALEAYRHLTDSFDMTESCGWIYPSEYAGAYIDGDNNLVISLVGRTAEMEEKYKKICGGDVNVIFKDGTYSLSQLEEFASGISRFERNYAITGYGVDEEEGAVVIDVERKDIQLLATTLYRSRSANNVDFLSFVPVILRESESAQTCGTELKGGDRITSGQGGSICIGGKFGGKSVILTAGHVTSAKNKVFYGTSTSNEIGKTIYSRFLNNKEGDYAIVEITNSKFTATNKVRNNTENGTITVKGVYSKPPKGTVVYKYGSVTKYSTGKIDSTNYTVTYKDSAGKIIAKIPGLCSVTMSGVRQGDSGGCVYTYYNLDNAYNICGSISGCTSTKMFYSPLVYAEKLGFTLK